MKGDLRLRDERGLFSGSNSMNIENTRRVSSQYMRDKEGIMLCETQGLSSEGRHGSSAPFSMRNLTSSDSTSPKGSPSGLSHTLSRLNRPKTR